jgi:hypothetical protein
VNSNGFFFQERYKSHKVMLKFYELLTHVWPFSD